MKKILVLLPILSFLILGACSQTPGETTVIEKDEYYIINPGRKPRSVKVIFTGRNSDRLNYSHYYSDEYFSNEFPDKLNINLAKVSFALSLSASLPAASGYLKNIGFKNVVSGLTANSVYKEDGVNVLFAHKKMGDQEMVAIAVRGYDYGVEWSSNMKIGLEGDHEGFHNAAYNALHELKAYLDKHKLNKNLSLWLAGYSRGGATINLMSKYIALDSQTHLGRSIETNNMYTYTFEAPKCSLLDSEHDYSFIHNLYNKNDFIAMNFPYDFTLLGNMHEYTHLVSSKEDVIDYGQQIDPTFDLPTFVNKKLSLFPMEIIDDLDSTVTEEEFYQIALSLLYSDLSKMDPSGTSSYVDVHTRENYVANIQKALQYVLSFLFILNNAQMETLQNYFIDHMGELVLSVGDTTGLTLYNMLVPIFQEIGAEYDETELKEVCAQLAPYLLTLLNYDGGDGLSKYIPTLAGNFSLIYENHHMTTIIAYLLTIPKE